MRNLSMNKIKYFSLTVLMFLTLAVSVSSQTPKPTPTPSAVLTSCEEVTDALTRANLDKERLQIQLDAANDKLSLQKERTANKEEQVQFYKTAYEKMVEVDKNSSKIDTNTALVISNLREQVNDYKNQNADLRRENDKLRTSREWRTILGTGVGFGAGYYFGSKK